EPQPRTVEQVAKSARSQFELELERARARTAEREKDAPLGGFEQQAEDTPPVIAAPPPAAAREGRPAVGTVISLPPRIKITERTPLSGRPPPGPQPVNPIRGRFAQQQQRGGPRPHGRPGG